MASPSPWLAIPLPDYEGHMNSPEVQQLSALSDLFAYALACCRPASVAILGIAGGNGLHRIDPEITTRLVGLDINATYLDAVRERFPALLGLELYCLNLAGQELNLKPVEMVHAALVFEHAGMQQCLENALSLVAPGGFLTVVLQLPSPIAHGVTPTNFASIQHLKSTFTLIDPISFCQTLAPRGFHLKEQSKRSLPAGKGLWLGIFSRA